MRLLVTSATLLALAATVFCQEPAKQLKKVPIAYTNPGSGSEMFLSYCATCHGNDGKGGGPAASALKKAPANLTLLTQKNHGKIPVLMVRNMIQGDTATAAHGSRDMPMWGDIFRSVSTGQSVVDIRIRALTDYIEKFQAR